MIIPEITAADAAEMIQHGDLLAVGGFGPAGSPKVITPALAKKHAENTTPDTTSKSASSQAPASVPVVTENSPPQKPSTEDCLSA